MKKTRLVMVGNGMAGVRTLEELLAIAPGRPGRDRLPERGAGRASRISEGLARGEKLDCGTHCGSCLPEVRAIAERVAANAGKMVA